MKKLSTIFPMWENSLGREIYNSPPKIRKFFIAFVFVFLTGFAFGQETTSTASKSEINISGLTIKTVELKEIKSRSINQKSDELRSNKSTENNKIDLNFTNVGISFQDKNLEIVKSSDLNKKSEKNKNPESGNNIQRKPEKNLSNNTIENQNPNQSPLEAVKGKREDISKRDMFSKTYQNEDDSFTALINAGPLHYQKNGQYLDIDTKVVQNPDANFPYANTANLMESYFGATSAKGVKSKTADGEVLEFLNAKMYWEVNGQAVNNQNAADTPALANGDKLTYPYIYGTISAEYQLLTAKRELNYIIPAKQALGDIPADAGYLVFSEDILLPLGWTANETDRGIVIKNNYGKSVYLYQNPISKDSSLGLSKEKNTIFESFQLGQMLTVKTKVKTGWLLDDERVFPVYVDPTVNIMPDNSDFWSISVYHDGDDLVPAGYFGLISSFWLQYHIKFNTNTIPGGANITDVTGYINQYGMAGTRHNGATWQWYNSADPAIVRGLSLYNSAVNPLSNTTNTQIINGWKSIAFTAAGRTYVKNSSDNLDYVAAAVVPMGTFYNNNYYANYNHTDGANRPYLSITYTDSTCAFPKGRNVTNITNNSATLTWNSVAGNTNGYEYVYNTTGTAPTVAGTYNAETSVNLTGLASNTVYHFWVRSRCNGATRSSWAYGGYFNTNPNDCFYGDGQVSLPPKL